MKNQETALKDLMEYLEKASHQSDSEGMMTYVDLANSRFNAWAAANKDYPEKQVAEMRKLMSEIYTAVEQTDQDNPERDYDDEEEFNQDDQWRMNDVETELSNAQLRIEDLLTLCENVEKHYNSQGNSI